MTLEEKKIPKIISKKGHEYIFVKEYPNFIMYQDMLIGTNECFRRQELGLIEEQTNIRYTNPKYIS